MKKQNIYSYAVKIFLALYFLGTTVQVFAQNSLVTIRDCTDNAPLPGVRLFDETNALLGTTDASGQCSIHISTFPVFIQKNGYNVATLYSEKDPVSRCLDRIQDHQLDEIVVKAKRLNVVDYLLQLRNENIPRFINRDTTVYYRFMYTLEFPEERWKETATGYIANEFFRTRSGFNDYYLQYHYTCTDTAFHSSKVYRRAGIIPLYSMLLYDLMGRTISDEADVSVWKKLTRPTQKQNRRLVFTRTPANDKIFTSYYGTSGYKMEQLVFDSLDNLQTVDYYTPEWISHVSWIRFHDDFTEEDSKRSTFHTHYTYSQGQPRLLQQVTHLSTFHNANRHYRTTFRLDLTGKKPDADFKILVFPYTKGKDVLEEIKEGHGLETSPGYIKMKRKNESVKSETPD